MLICTVVPDLSSTPSLRFQASEVPSRYLFLKSTLPVQQGSDSSTACLVCDPLPDPSASSEALTIPSNGFQTFRPALLVPLSGEPYTVMARFSLLFTRTLMSQPTPAFA